MGATTGTIREIGGLVFLSCARRAEVELDGHRAGTTPLLLELEPGRHDLVVRTQDKVFRRRLVVSEVSAGSFDRLEAELVPYTGSLILHCSAEGALLSVDGAAPSPLEDGTAELTEGRHRLIVSAAGKVPFETELIVPREASVELAVELEPGFPLRFAVSPPEASILLVFGERGDMPARSLDPSKPALLAGGSTRFKLLLPTGQALDFTWDPSGPQPAQLSLKGRLVLSPLPVDALVEIDEKATPGKPTQSAEYDLEAGMHTVKVKRPGFLPFVVYCEIVPGSEVKPILVFLKDMVAEKARKKALGLPILASGGVLAAGGLAFSADSIAIALSTDYSSYKLLKYLGMGALGTGLAAFLSGFGIIVL